MDDFELHNFVDEANFDQFIDLIRGENEDQLVHGTFDCHDLINGLLDESHHQFPSINPNYINHASSQEMLFDFNTMLADHHHLRPVVLDSNIMNVPPPPPQDHQQLFASVSPTFDYDYDHGLAFDQDGEDSSGTTTTTNTTTTTSKREGKTDRSRTLISERSRRGRMKDKLYALRALVPNITKMDKASIIGDAISYMQQLQMQARKLKTEISGLEGSLIGSQQHQMGGTNKGTQHTTANLPVVKKITQMDMFQVEERGFYVRVVCNKGERVAALLYKALESLNGFHVKNINLTTTSSDSQTYALTFTLHVKESGHDMNLPNLKLWVAGALLNQGFEFLTDFPSQTEKISKKTQ